MSLAALQKPHNNTHSPASTSKDCEPTRITMGTATAATTTTTNPVSIICCKETGSPMSILDSNELSNNSDTSFRDPLLSSSSPTSSPSSSNRFAVEVTQIAKMRAHAMLQSDSYKKLMTQVSSKTLGPSNGNLSNGGCIVDDILRGSQLELGKCIMTGSSGTGGRGGFNGIYKVKSISKLRNSGDRMTTHCLRQKNPQRVSAGSHETEETEATEDVTEGCYLEDEEGGGDHHHHHHPQEYHTYDDCVVRVLRNDLEKDKAVLALSAAEIVKEGLLMASLDSPYILKARACPAAGLAAGFSLSSLPLPVQQRQPSQSLGRYPTKKQQRQQAQQESHDAFFLVMDNLQTTLAERLSGEYKTRALVLQFATWTQRRSRRQDFLAERLLVALQLADAMSYIHRLGILHRDLKPSNVGFAPDGTVKLFDFDHARLLPVSSHSNNSSSNNNNETNNKKTNHKKNRTTMNLQLYNLTAMVGTLRYMSPECGKGEPYNLQSDVYTFGLILYQILSLKEPYQEIPPSHHRTYVFRGGLRPTVPTSCSEALQRLVQDCWAQSIASRPTMMQVHAILYNELVQLRCESTARQARRSQTRKN